MSRREWHILYSSMSGWLKWFCSWRSEIDQVASKITTIHASNAVYQAEYAFIGFLLLYLSAFEIHRLGTRARWMRSRSDRLAALRIEDRPIQHPCQCGEAFTHVENLLLVVTLYSHFTFNINVAAKPLEKDTLDMFSSWYQK